MPLYCFMLLHITANILFKNIYIYTFYMIISYIMKNMISYKNNSQYLISMIFYIKLI